MNTMNMTRRSFIVSCAAALAIGWDLMHGVEVAPRLRLTEVHEIRDWLTMELRRMLTEQIEGEILSGPGQYYFAPVQRWIPVVME